MYDDTAAYYDLLDADDAPAHAHCDFVFGYARAMTHALDVGAGTGRCALHLARNGVRVWAAEPSAAMRAAFLSQLGSDRRLDAYVTLLPQPAEALHVGRRFPLVYAAHVLYLIDGVHETLMVVREHLEPGGVFIGDFALRAGRRPRTRALAAERRIGEVTYRRYSATRRLDYARWAVTWEFEAARGGEALERASETFVVRTRTIRQCRDALRRAGFSIERECGGYDGRPLASETDAARYVFVARHVPNKRRG